MTIFLFINLEKMFQTLSGLKAVNTIDGDAHKISFRDYKSRISKNFYFGKIKFLLGSRDRSGRPIILMSMPSGDQAIIGCLNFDNNFGNRVALANTMKTKITGNTWVVILPARITALALLITNYSERHGAARKTAWNALHAFLLLILRDFQDYADLHRIDAITALQSAGFHIKEMGGTHAQIFEGFTGEVAGTIELFCPVGSSDGSVHGWKLYSADHTTWAWTKPTGVAHNIMSGLVSGSLANVSHTEIVGEVEQEESQIIAVRVK